MKKLNITLLSLITALSPLAYGYAPVFAEEIQEKEDQAAKLQQEIESLEKQIEIIYTGINKDFLELTQDERAALTKLLSKKADTVYAAMDTAQATIDSLQEFYSSIEADLTEKRASVETASTELAELQGMIDTAKESEQALAENIVAWQKEAEGIEAEIAELESYKTTPDTIEAEITALNEEIEALESQQAKGMYGLMEYIQQNGSTEEIKTAAAEALSILNDTTGAKADGIGENKYPEITVKSENDADPASEANISKIIELLEAVNEKRVNDDLFPGREAYPVSLPLIATSLKAAQVNDELKTMQHFQIYEVGETIASTNDPATAVNMWYSEKEVALKLKEENPDTFSEETVSKYQPYNAIGHYEHIISSKNTCVGGAVGTGVSVLNFQHYIPSYTQGTISVEDFKKLAEDYLSYKETLQEKIDKRDAKQSLLANIDNVDAAITEKTTALAELTGKIDTAQAEQQSLTDTLAGYETEKTAAETKLAKAEQALADFMTEHGDSITQYESAVDTLVKEQAKENDLKVFAEMLLAEDMEVIAGYDLAELKADYEADTEMQDILDAVTELQEVANSKMDEYAANILPLELAIQEKEDALAELSESEKEEIDVEPTIEQAEEKQEKASSKSTGVEAGNAILPGMAALAGLCGTLLFRKKKK